MGYKSGDKVVIVKERTSGMNSFGEMDIWLGKTMTIDTVTHEDYLPYAMVEDGENWSWDDDMIDYEATAKLNKSKPLPQPSKSLLRSGMKVVYRNKREWFCLIELGRIFTLHFGYDNLGSFNEDLTDVNNEKQYDIMQIWDGDTLIAQRTEKSEKQIEIERIENEILGLTEKLNKLKEELV